MTERHKDSEILTESLERKRGRGMEERQIARGMRRVSGRGSERWTQSGKQTYERPEKWGEAERRSRMNEIERTMYFEN